jgi:hypothetical protein
MPRGALVPIHFKSLCLRPAHALLLSYDACLGSSFLFASSLSYPPARLMPISCPFPALSVLLLPIMKHTKGATPKGQPSTQPS